MILELAELPIIFWLLIWGAKVKRSDSPASSSATQAGGSDQAKRVRLRGRPKTRAAAKQLFDHLLRQGLAFELVSEKVRAAMKVDVNEFD